MTTQLTKRFPTEVLLEIELFCSQNAFLTCTLTDADSQKQNKIQAYNHHDIVREFLAQCLQEEKVEVSWCRSHSATKIDSYLKPYHLTNTISMTGWKDRVNIVDVAWNSAHFFVATSRIRG